MHASCSEVVKSAHQVCERSSEAVDAHDYEGVSAPKPSVTLAPLCAFHGGAAGVINVDGIAPGGTKGLDLGGWILVCCAHSRVSGDTHGHNRIGLVVAMSLFWPGFLDCSSGEYYVFPAHMATIGRFWRMAGPLCSHRPYLSLLMRIVVSLFVGFPSHG